MEVLIPHNPKGRHGIGLQNARLVVLSFCCGARFKATSTTGQRTCSNCGAVHAVPQIKGGYLFANYFLHNVGARGAYTPEVFIETWLNLEPGSVKVEADL